MGMIHITLLLSLFICLYIFHIAVRLILNRLNISHLRSSGDSVPQGFEDIIDGPTLSRMRDYTVETSHLGSIENLSGDVIILAIILSGFLPWLNEKISAWDLNFVFSGILFFFACSLITGVVEIPFDLYRNFVIEKKFSFNTLTLKLWITDLIKTVLVSAIVMGLFLAIFFGIILYAPTTWWIWAWIFFILFQVIIMWLYPVVIAPLFNKFEPVEDQDLKSRIYALAGKSGIKVKGLYTMDAGKRSRHSNAYFTGIGKTKRIVLFDTLVHTHTTEEILAVLAHELGHWKKGHIRKQLILSMVVSLGLLYLAYVLTTHPVLYTTFGFENITIYVGLFLLTIIAKPFAFFLTPLGCMISRWFERQADDYAYVLTGESVHLVNALKQLAKNNLANLHPHKIYAWFYYSHPPIVERIRRLEKLP